jgi:hypothetical protein
MGVFTLLGCFAAIALVSEYSKRQYARLRRQWAQLEEYMEENYG